MRLRDVLGIAAFGLFFGFLLGTCSQAHAQGFTSYRLHGTPCFTDNPKLVPKAATDVQQYTPRREFTVDHRVRIFATPQVYLQTAPVGSVEQPHTPAPVNTTENGPFTCVRERRQFGDINRPVYVTRDPQGNEVNETPSVWGCPQTSINR